MCVEGGVVGVEVGGGESAGGSVVVMQKVYPVEACLTTGAPKGGRCAV